jgi:hypothetical protein
MDIINFRNDDFIIVMKLDKDCSKVNKIINNLIALGLKYVIINYNEELKIKQPGFKNFLKRVSHNNICYPMVFHKFIYISNIGEYLENIKDKIIDYICQHGYVYEKAFKENIEYIYTIPEFKKQIVFHGYENI